MVYFMNNERMFSAEEAIKKVRVNNFIQIWFLAFIRFLIYWSISFGVIILIFRIFHFRSNFLLWYLSGIFFAILYAIDFALKNNASRETCIACIDAFNKAGGLLIAENETNDLRWKSVRNHFFEIPKSKKYYSKSHIYILFASLLFVYACSYVPIINFRNVVESRRINLTNKVAEIKEQIKLLEQEDIIDKNERLTLESSLEDIVNNSDKESPGITFESLDQMADKLKHEAVNDMKKRINDLDILKRLENYAKDAKEAALESKKLKESLEKLKNQLRQAGLSEEQINDLLKQNFGNSNLTNGLNKELADSYSKSISKNIKQKIQQNSELVSKLMDSNLLDEATKQKIEQSLASSDSENKDYNENNSFFDVSSEQNKIEKENNKNGNSGQEGKSGKSGKNDQESQLDNNGNSGQDGKSGKSGKNDQESQLDNNSNSGQEGKSGKSRGNGQEGQSGETNGEYGNGGISRGGGETPMTFGDKASDYNAKYRDEVLPEVKSESALGAVSIGIGIADPKVDKEKGSYTSGLIKTTNKSINSNNEKNLLPKYKNAVRNYFSN